MMQRLLYLYQKIYDKCFCIFVTIFLKNKRMILVLYTYRFTQLPYFYAEFFKRNFMKNAK